MLMMLLWVQVRLCKKQAEKRQKEMPIAMEILDDKSGIKMREVT